MNVLLALLVLTLSLVTDVLANECVVETGTPTFSNGKRINLQCDENGKLKSTASGGGGAGDASAANQTTMIGHLDGVEGLIGTTNTTLSTIDGRVDGLETLIGTTNSSLTTIDGRVDGLEALVTSTNSKLDTAITALQLIDDDQTGASTCYITSAASTNATNCKASAGRVTLIRVINTTATLYYLRMYNLAASPTCSSSTGFVETIPVPASTSGAGVVSPTGPAGQAYGTGIGFCLTGGGSSTDNTNAATGVYVTILYK